MERKMSQMHDDPSKRLGDQPIEPNFREMMNQLAAGLDELFNGEAARPAAKGIPDQRKVGFVLLVFPFENHEGRANYISNGANRDDIVALFKEQIKRFEGQPEVAGKA
jgi:hypothetical protein